MLIGFALLCPISSRQWSATNFPAGVACAPGMYPSLGKHPNILASTSFDYFETKLLHFARFSEKFSFQFRFNSSPVLFCVLAFALHLWTRDAKNGAFYTVIQPCKPSLPIDRLTLTAQRLISNLQWFLYLPARLYLDLPHKKSRSQNPEQTSRKNPFNGFYRHTKMTDRSPCSRFNSLIPAPCLPVRYPFALNWFGLIFSFFLCVVHWTDSNNNNVDDVESSCKYSLLVERKWCA